MNWQGSLEVPPQIESLAGYAAAFAALTALFGLARLTAVLLARRGRAAGEPGVAAAAAAAAHLFLSLAAAAAVLGAEEERGGGQ